MSTLTSIKYSTNDEFDLWGDIKDEEESNALVLEDDNDDEINDDLMDDHNNVVDKSELMSRGRNRGYS